MPVAAAMGQFHTLLGRLKVLEPGTAAAGKRIETQVQEQKWRRTVQAMFLSEMQGRNITCRGFAILD